MRNVAAAAMIAAGLAVGMAGRPQEALGADTSAGQKPNIVFIFIDDLGWTDLGCMGSDFYETPHIDRLARDGMLFTRAYSNGPNCAPSRASLMSGQYTPRHGVFTVGDPARGRDRYRKLVPIENKTVLDDRFVTIAEALHAAGYVTATMGKWHLGKDPTTQGFDVNIAGCQWGSPRGGGYHSPYRYPNLVNDQPGEYLTDRLTQEACEFIESNRDRPFFLYLTHYAVHTPLQGRKDLVEKYKAKAPGKRHRHPVYAAMIESVDQSLGAVLAKLDELGLTERTLVIFTSDNGGVGGVTDNSPLRGAKGMLYEGGIRVPLIVKWPGRVAPGTKCEVPVIGVDFYPTLLEVTGTPMPSGYTLDGQSLVPLLTGEGTFPERAIYWHFPCYLQASARRSSSPFRTTPAGAIRVGDWKLIEFFEDGRLELYNTRQDIGETHNLATERPQKLRELHTRLLAWRQQVGAPVPTRPNPKYDPTAQWPPTRPQRPKGKRKGR
ncbi:MAG: sulfatase [Planctomycetes bacterium]|nr:sulfatase [Planctomycetota bacterium]